MSQRECESLWIDLAETKIIKHGDCDTGIWLKFITWLIFKMIPCLSSIFEIFACLFNVMINLCCESEYVAYLFGGCLLFFTLILILLPELCQTPSLQPFFPLYWSYWKRYSFIYLFIYFWGIVDLLHSPFWASLVDQVVNNLPAIWVTWVWYPSLEDT